MANTTRPELLLAAACGCTERSAARYLRGENIRTHKLRRELEEAARLLGLVAAARAPAPAPAEART